MNALELADALTAEWNGEGFKPDTSKDAAAMLRRQHEAILKLRAALVDCKYGLESARIWGGMEWTYNPLHAFKYLPLRDRAEQALKDTEDLK